MQCTQLQSPCTTAKYSGPTVPTVLPSTELYSSVQPSTVVLLSPEYSQVQSPTPQYSAVPSWLLQTLLTGGTPPSTQTPARRGLGLGGVERSPACWLHTSHPAGLALFTPATTLNCSLSLHTCGFEVWVLPGGQGCPGSSATGALLVTVGLLPPPAQG